ncbi:Mor transcription activator family protein [Thalassolituus sp. UBA3500]|jgi:Mor family transcriptional regulator|uniref:Mor transcription activator family protein n=1 Tax=Thalassolituus sp. UBA3500 TaxID=1947664 RepID=UPI00263A6856|nr:Mor transcription activator family protein [Thalassolituus sp. UBA3500]|tara:strand:+ start:8190 stop:8582 length:393 start_codon:yes stop_codon:yes gene_type:complete
MIPEHIEQNLLPESIRDIIDLVGISAALRIVEERGGIRLYVPKTPAVNHWLSDLIGLDNMTALVNVYAGEEIEIPRCAAALKAIKDHEIATAEGSVTELARRYGYTERGIRKIRRRVEEQGGVDQMGLFD